MIDKIKPFLKYFHNLLEIKINDECNYEELILLFQELKYLPNLQVIYNSYTIIDIQHISIYSNFRFNVKRK